MYDVADLYKMEIAVPVAFAHHKQPNPERVVRSMMRSKLRLLKLTRQIVTDIQTVIDPNMGEEPTDRTREQSEITHLWDPELGPIPDGTNYSTSAADEPF